MERQSKGPRDLEAYCSGGQGPPRAVAPTDDDDARLTNMASVSDNQRAVMETTVLQVAPVDSLTTVFVRLKSLILKVINIAKCCYLCPL